MKVNVLKVLCNECRCSREIDPNDEECALDKVIELLINRLRIEKSDLICVCRFDRTRCSEHVPYCEGSYKEGYFDILICTFRRGKCNRCIALECKISVKKLKKDIGGNVEDLLHQIRRYNDVYNREKSKCDCGGGPLKFIVINKNIRISKTVLDNLRNEKWEVLRV